MKQILRYIPTALMATVLFISCSYGQSQNNITENEVKETLASLDKALIERNKSQLDELTHADLSYGHSSGSIQNKDVFIDDVLNGPFQFVSISNSKQEIIVNGNTAVERHVLEGEGINSGNPTQLKLGMIMVFTKDSDGKVKLLARQAYRIP